MFDLIITHNGKNCLRLANFIGLPVFTKDLALPDFKSAIICVSNAGNEELPLDFEDFLINFNIKNKKYCIVELGNYFGYEWEEFGCAKIVRRLLNNLEWEEVFPVLILDSFPEIDWSCVKNWMNLSLKKF